MNNLINRKILSVNKIRSLSKILLLGTSCAYCTLISPLHASAQFDDGEHKSSGTTSSCLFDVEKVSGLITEISNEIKAKIALNPDATRVLLLGKSGVGKSTLANALCGHVMNGKEDSFNHVLELSHQNATNIFAMNSAAESETSKPQHVFLEKHNLVLWDLPGFFDSRGDQQKILNEFAIDQMFERPSKIKCILMLSESDLREIKLNTIIATLDKMLAIIPSEEELMQGLSIVIGTHAHTEITPSQYILHLRDKLINVSVPAKNKYLYLLEGLLERKNKNLGGLYSFPTCKEKGLYEKFVGKDLLIEDLKNPNTTIINPGHQIKLSTDVLINISKVLTENADIGSMLGYIIPNIIKDLESVNGEELQKWQELFFALTEMYSLNRGEDTAMEMIRKLAEHVKTGPNHNPNMEVVLNNLESSVKYIKFAKKVAPSLGNGLNIPAVGNELNKMVNNLKGYADSRKETIDKISLNESLKKENNRLDADSIKEREDGIKKQLIAQKQHEEHLERVKNSANQQIQDLKNERDRLKQAGIWERFFNVVIDVITFGVRHWNGHDTVETVIH